MVAAGLGAAVMSVPDTQPLLAETAAALVMELTVDSSVLLTMAT